MKGDIALAGFMMTAEEWQALDSISRAQLVAAATPRDEGWGVAPVSCVVLEQTMSQRDEER
jgi:hypothetical protein